MCLLKGTFAFSEVKIPHGDGSVLLKGEKQKRPVEGTLQLSPFPIYGNCMVHRSLRRKPAKATSSTEKFWGSKEEV